MNDSTPIETQSEARPLLGRLPLALACAGLLAACGGGGGVGGSLDNASPGQSTTKPGAGNPFNGGAYIVDPNNAGTAQSLELIEMEWGRLVDILDTGPNGEPRLIFNDFLVGQEVRDRSEGGVQIWDFETNPVTGESTLQIFVDIQADPDLFDFRIFEATAGLTPVPATGLGTLGVPPFPLVARNSTLSLRFNDLIDEDSITLNETVQILVGSPPITPFDARLIPDPSRGGIGADDGQFHSTRLLVDFTITESELPSINEVVELNGLGLPASPDLLNANVGIRIPTQLAPAEGVFALFTNLRGEALDPGANEPIDLSSASNDVVRGMRSGNPEDPNNGFLVDLDRPQVLGVQPVVITAAEPVLSTPDDPRDFRVSFSYAVPACAIDPTVGDQVQLADFPLAVDASGTVVGSTANNILVRSPASLDPPTATSFLGQSGQFSTAWRSSLNPALAPCFVRFTPSAGLLPVTEVDPNSSVVMRFSEPLDPASVRPFDTLYVATSSIVDAEQTEGPTAPQPDDLVVGDVIASPDFTEYRFSPLVPFNHVGGTSEAYFLNMVSSVDSGIVDLAGNGLLTVLPRVEFRMDPNEASEDTGGWVFRFNAVNEDSNPGPEVRGQFLFDLINGQLNPRIPSRFGATLDRSQPMVGAMQAIPTGLQTPLASAGSRAHLTWRYTDVGYSISQTEGNLYDLDVEGISLSPLGGTLTNTSYPEFEIQLAHGARVPDERVGDANLLPEYPNSGFEPNNSFSENFLGDPADGPQVVYPRENGFVVSSADIFQSSTSTPLLPMPWNRGVSEDEKTFFTWRNTAITTLGSTNESAQLVGAGVPLDQEVLILGLTQDAGDAYGIGGSGGTGVEFPAGVPTIGLPL
ncbi:MAG: Ig-like domain-containing protein, partial [Planctomycetota bacterium]